jgi:hypothetical protein
VCMREREREETLRGVRGIVSGVFMRERREIMWCVNMCKHERVG